MMIDPICGIARFREYAASIRDINGYCACGERERGRERERERERMVLHAVIFNASLRDMFSSSTAWQLQVPVCR